MPTMQTYRRRTAAVEQELTAYEARWQDSLASTEDEEQQQADSLRARRRPFERLLRFGILVFEELEDLNANWRLDVFRAVQDYANEDEATIRGLYERWLKVCHDDWLRQRMDYFIRQSGRFAQDFPAAGEFQRCCARARETVERWVAPVKALAVVHHAEDLTEDDMNRLDEIAASGKARLKIEPKRIQ